MKWLRNLWKPAGPEAVLIRDAVSMQSAAPLVEPVAFVSDIHANLQALQAVLSDIASQGVREIVCLGDIAGYGGSPAECVQLIRDAGIPCIRGNHDDYVGGGALPPAGRGTDFEEACRWAREQIGEEGCRWLANLPLVLSRDDFEAVHTSLHRPEQWNYLDIAPAAELHFRHQTKPVCFVGHTHQPIMWIEGEERPAGQTNLENLRPTRKQVVNVGSVGQPRDEDERACYLILRRREKDVWWRRAPYDIEGAQRAILEAGLPFRNAERLQRGE